VSVILVTRNLVESSFALGGGKFKKKKGGKIGEINNLKKREKGIKRRTVQESLFTISLEGVVGTFFSPESATDGKGTVG